MSEPAPPVWRAQTDSDVQTRFVQQNLRRIFLLIYRIVGNVDDAQDLTQETFIKALQREAQLKDLDKAGHWLSRIAANTAIDFLRRNRKFSFVDVTQLSETAHSSLESPEQTLLRGERKLHLDGGLAVLTNASAWRFCCATWKRCRPIKSPCR